MATYNVKLSQVTMWTLGAGWTWTKVSLSGVDDEGPIASVDNGPFNPSPTLADKILQFAVQWTVAPVEGDVITIAYDGSGDFRKDGSPVGDDLLPAFTDTVITNCADPQSNVTAIGAWAGAPDCNPGAPVLLSATLIGNDVRATFDRPVYFVDHTAINIRNKTTGDIAIPANGAPLYLSDEVTGSRVLTFNNIQWNTAPVGGDLLRFNYGFETVILDTFNGVGGQSITTQSPEIGPNWLAIGGGSGDHEIAVDNQSAVGNVDTWWTNIIDSGADTPSVFAKIKYLASNTGSLGAIMRSTASPSAGADALYIAMSVDAAGTITSIGAYNWNGTVMASFSNPFPTANVFNGVELVYDDLAGGAGSGIEVHVTGDPTTVLFDNTDIGMPSVGTHQYAGMYSQNFNFDPNPGGENTEDRVYENFAVIRHPVGNYTDATGTPIDGTTGVDVT